MKSASLGGRKNSDLQRRLDHFFISDFLQDLVETVDILPSVQSGHSILKLKFSPFNEWCRNPTMRNIYHSKGLHESYTKM